MGLHLLQAHRQSLQLLHFTLPQDSCNDVEVFSPYFEGVSGAELQVPLDALNDYGLLPDGE